MSWVRYMQRAVALALVAFMLLASARSLVPNLCATQNAMDEAAAACETATSCCAPKPLDSSTGASIKSPQKDHPDCAFCYLAASVTEQTATASISDATPVDTPKPTLTASLVRTRDLDNAHLGRAPPA